MTGVRTTTGLEGIASFNWRDAGGLHTASAIRFRDADNNLQGVFGIGGIVATAVPSDVYGYGNSHAPIVISTSSATVSVVGGSPPYTFSWGVEFSNFEPISPSSQTCAFRTTSGVGPGDGDNGVASCTVTDSDGRIATSNMVNLNVQNFGT